MSNQPLNLLLIDDDPIFRLGLATALARWQEIQALDQASTPQEALTQINQNTYDLVLLEPNLGADSQTGWEFAQNLRESDRERKICLLSNTADLAQLKKAQDRGINGYCAKRSDIEQIIAVIERIIQGETVWDSLPSFSLLESSVRLSRHPQWLSRLRQSGMGQITTNLNQINAQLNQAELSKWDQLFWQGRRRELAAARWLIEQLLPVEVVVISPANWSSVDRDQLRGANEGLEEIVPAELSLPILFQSAPTATIFQHTYHRLKTPLPNLTKIPLEIDILKLEKREALLILVLNQLGKALERLRFAEVSLTQLPQNLADILQPVWQDSTLSFLGKYGSGQHQLTLEELQDLLEEDQEAIQTEILDKIPFLVEFFSYFLKENSLRVEAINYRYDSPEAMGRAELILQNIIIQLANSIMVFILNRFSDQEKLKEILYNEDGISSREMARFRNNLTWKYRLDNYWETPKQIFESRYRLYYCSEKGIKTTQVYFPRQQELNQLQGLPWLVTMGLEIRDAIAPRLRAVIGWVGQGIVYLLTQVIGRGIGLIGRGILQGVGSTLPEARSGKQPRRDAKDSQSPDKGISNHT